MNPEKFYRADFEKVNQEESQQEISAKEGLEHLEEKHRKETENFHFKVESEKEKLDKTKEEMMAGAHLEALYVNAKNAEEYVRIFDEELKRNGRTLTSSALAKALESKNEDFRKSIIKDVLHTQRFSPDWFLLTAVNIGSNELFDEALHVLKQLLQDTAYKGRFEVLHSSYWPSKGPREEFGEGRNKNWSNSRQKVLDELREMDSRRLVDTTTPENVEHLDYKIDFLSDEEVRGGVPRKYYATSEDVLKYFRSNPKLDVENRNKTIVCPGGSLAGREFDGLMVYLKYSPGDYRWHVSPNQSKYYVHGDDLPPVHYDNYVMATKI